MMRDIGGAIPQVRLPWFKDNILPPLRPEFNIQALVNVLKANGAITKDGFWKKFYMAPAQSNLIENTVFRSFAQVAEAAGLAAATVLPTVRQTVVFKCNPDMILVSTLRNSGSKPDGYGLYTRHESYQEDGPLFWEVIVAPGEQKKNDAWDAVKDVGIRVNVVDFNSC